MPESNAERLARPPHMGDMFLAGLELRQAVALQRRIADQPELTPDVWWALLEEMATGAAPQ
jgi:hypothetical protein